MSNDVRLKFTEAEKMAMEASNYGGTTFNMSTDRDINTILEKEKAAKFNEELNRVAEKFADAGKKIQENAEAFGDSIAKIEIKPMGSRLLIKPFKQNPFQRIKIENGIIVDAGGFTPHTELNPRTGRVEEQKEFIVVGAVQEVGPDVKYVEPGDCVFYRIDCALPVPFFKEGLISVAETNIIAIVNEGLEDRFNK